MLPAKEPKDTNVAKLAVIDEILQVMFWLRGENLAASITAGDLTQWIGLETDEMRSLLERMSLSGLVECVSGGPVVEVPRFALTAEGIREGGRRFADEFAHLTRQAHGECGDPNCECHRTGNPEDCTHRRDREIMP